MRTEWWKAIGYENPWPRCVVGSGLAHLVLLGACLLIQPGFEHVTPTLRVKLVEEVTASAPGPVVAEVRPTPRPAKVVAPPQRSSRPLPPAPVLPVSEALPVVAPTPEPMAVPPPAPEVIPRAPALSPAHLSPSQETTPASSPPSVAAAVASPPAAGNDATETHGARGTGDVERLELPSGGFGPPLPSPVSDSRARGMFYISGQGNGQGSADGAGTGPGSGPGRGPGAGRGNGSGEGVGEASGGGTIARDGGGVLSNGAGMTDLLRAVRRRIEQAKVYPDTARRQGMQGIVEVRFRIGLDGAVAAVEVVRSSGHALLDQDSTDTVRRAAPYPPILGWVRIPLAYRLDP